MRGLGFAPASAYNPQALMVRRREAPCRTMSFAALILRDAANGPLLMMRSVLAEMQTTDRRRSDTWQTRGAHP